MLYDFNMNFTQRNEFYFEFKRTAKCLASDSISDLQTMTCCCRQWC